MPQQKDNDDFENNGFVLETSNPTLTSKNTSRETEPESILEAEGDEKVSFFERWKTSRFWLVRGTYYVLYSVWMIVVVIGGFIAWLISLLFI